jgi:carbonic anhydrase
LACAAALTKAQRDEMAPADIIARKKKGNERFRKAKEIAHDYLAQQRASASTGQRRAPRARITGCDQDRRIDVPPQDGHRAILYLTDY